MKDPTNIDNDRDIYLYEDVDIVINGYSEDQLKTLSDCRLKLFCQLPAVCFVNFMNSLDPIIRVKQHTLFSLFTFNGNKMFSQVKGVFQVPCFTCLKVRICSMYVYYRQRIYVSSHASNMACSLWTVWTRSIQTYTSVLYMLTASVIQAYVALNVCHRLIV